MTRNIPIQVADESEKLNLDQSVVMVTCVPDGTGIGHAIVQPAFGFLDCRLSSIIASTLCELSETFPNEFNTIFQRRLSERQGRATENN